MRSCKAKMGFLVKENRETMYAEKISGKLTKEICTDLKQQKLEPPSKLFSCKSYFMSKLHKQRVLIRGSVKKLPFCILMQQPRALFYCIIATINSLQGFENTAEVPITNLLKTNRKTKTIRPPGA